MKEKIKEFVRFQIKRLRRSVRRTAGKIVIRETTVDFEEMGIVRECPGIFRCASGAAGRSYSFGKFPPR